MKLASAFFKFSSSERFSKNVSRLFLRRDELYFDCVVFYFLTSKVIFNFKVFGFFMKDWIVAKFDATLIVAKKRSRLVVQ